MKKIIILFIALVFGSFALADDVMTQTSSSDSSQQVNSSQLLLKWQIEWNYKAVLKWSKLNWTDIVNKYLLLLSYDKEPNYPNSESDQVFTIDSDKDSIENWKIQKWTNYFRVIAITQDEKIYSSNVVKIVMDWNGKQVYDTSINTTQDYLKKYDYNYQNQEKIDEDYVRKFKDSLSTYENPYKIIDEDFSSKKINKVTWQKAWNYIWEYKKQFTTTWTTKTSLTDEQKKQIEELKKNLEDSLKSLRENINSTNVEESKLKYNELKSQYLEKITSDIPWAEYLKKMIEERFNVFYKTNFASTVTQSKELKQQTKDIKKELKQDNKKEVKKTQEKTKIQKLIDEKLWIFYKQVSVKITDKDSQIALYESVKQKIADKKASATSESLKQALWYMYTSLEQKINELKDNWDVSIALDDILKI